MKILVLASDGFGGHGGIALYARNVLAALAAHPSHPEVVGLPRVAPLAVGPLPEGVRWELGGVGGKVKYALSVAAAARQSFDLVVCTHVHLLALAYAVAKIRRVPVILFVYGIEVTQPTPKWLVNQLIGKVDALVSIRRQTTRMLKSWCKVDGVHEYLLENAIHLERYGIAPKNPALVEKYGLAGRLVVMTMGRVEEAYKGFDEVLEVLPRLLKEFPNIVYVIAGGGYDVPRLQEKARTLGVAEHTVFTGFVEDEEKADHYRLADVYAMPGTGPDFDRYPLRFVFLEAMACGVPVVGALPEDAEEARVDGALLAELVDPINPDDIVRGIVNVLSLRLQPEIPKDLHRFSFPEFQKRLHAIINSVVARA